MLLAGVTLLLLLCYYTLLNVYIHIYVVCIHLWYMYTYVWECIPFLFIPVIWSYCAHCSETRSGVLLCRAIFYPYKVRDFPDLSLPDTPVPLWNAREHLVSCCFRVVPWCPKSWLLEPWAARTRWDSLMVGDLMTDALYGPASLRSGRGAEFVCWVRS